MTSAYPLITIRQIVEVVGDAAGKASDGLHLLRLAELIFEQRGGR